MRSDVVRRRLRGPLVFLLLLALAGNFSPMVSAQESTPVSGEPSSITVIPQDPAVTQATCLPEGTASSPSVIPAVTEGILYEVSTPLIAGAPFIVTARLDAGSSWATDAPEGWTDQQDGSRTFDGIFDPATCVTPTAPPQDAAPATPTGAEVQSAAVIPNAISNVRVVETAIENITVPIQIEVTMHIGTDVAMLDTFDLTLDPRLNSGGNFPVSAPNGDPVGILVLTSNAGQFIIFQPPTTPLDLVFTFPASMLPMTAEDTLPGMRDLVFTTGDGVVFHDSVMVAKKFGSAENPVPLHKEGYWPDDNQDRMVWQVWAPVGPYAGATVIDVYGGGPGWEFDCINISIEPSSIVAGSTIDCTSTSVTVTLPTVFAGTQPLIIMEAIVTDPSQSGDLVLANTATVSIDGGEPVSYSKNLRQTLNAAAAPGPTVPETPDFVQVFCSGPEQTIPSYTQPLNGGGVTYTSVGDAVAGGQIVLTGVLSEGYTWDTGDPAMGGWVVVDESTATFTIPFDAPDCATVNLLAPEIVTQPTCDTDAVIEIPRRTNGVSYAREGSYGPGGQVITTATLADGYAFPDPLPTGWVLVDATTATHILTFDDADCNDVATLPVPTIVQPTCEDGQIINGLVTADESTGVLTSVSGNGAPGETVTVTATLVEGFAFPETLPTGWVLVDATTARFEVTLETPTCGEPTATPDPGSTPTPESTPAPDGTPIAGTTPPPGKSPSVTSLPNTGSQPSSSGTSGFVLIALMCMAALMAATTAFVRRSHKQVRAAQRSDTNR